MACMVHSTFHVVVLVLVLSIAMIVKGQEAATNQSCPHFGVNFRGRCFWFVNFRVKWSEAAQLCHRLHGDRASLVTIKDEETNNFLRNQFHRAFWIGLHEAHGETIWRWVDNTEPSNYQNWEGGAPPPRRSDNRNCGIRKINSEFWLDYNCGQPSFSVCAELPSAPMCPYGGIFFRDRCYWRGRGHLPWAAADQACQDEFGPDARLAVARDAETNLFLSRLGGSQIWLGLSDRRREGVWEWIDGAPLEYENWRSNEPTNNDGIEDCVIMNYPDPTWNDVYCGDPVPGRDRVTLSQPYICAIPPCYQTIENSGEELVTVSNQGVRIIDHSICAQTECNERCVNAGACNSTGKCVCVKQFPGMTCNLDQWKVELDNEIVNTTTGSILTLKCNFNLPEEHISSVTWTKCDPPFLPQYRQNKTNSFSQGFSTLQISDASMVDAGEYYCKVVLDFTDITMPVARKAVVNVIDAEDVPSSKGSGFNSDEYDKRTEMPYDSDINKDRNKESSKASKIHSTGGNTAIIVFLAVMTSMLLGTVVILMIKIKTKAASEKGGFIQMDNNI